MTLHHLIVSALAAALLLAVAADARAAESSALRIYVGTYTSAKSKGIHLLRLDLASGRLTYEALAAETANPTFLAIHPNGRFIYAAGEVSQFNNQPTGVVTAFAINPATGMLDMLNQQPSGGRGACHVSVDPTGRVVLVANYGGGNVAALPIEADGRLRPPSATIQHEGSGPNPRRQRQPHAHAINPDPAGRFALAADLGIDKIMIYRLDAAAGTLAPNDPAFATLAPGAGPRHLSFHPNGRLSYVINELDNTITAFAYDARNGGLTQIQTINTLPAGFEASNTTAEVVVHPGGRFIYGSNRGHDSIAAFSIDEQTGRLAAIGHYPTQGKTPRNFNIDPSGRYLVVANQNTDNLAVFRIDTATGRLDLASTLEGVGAPVCVRFLRQ
jgi:6-phosphogluconolactonase